MTARRYVTIKCDGCVRSYYDGRSIGVRQARERASVRGWTMRRVPFGGGMQPRDLCPGCATSP